MDTNTTQQTAIDMAYNNWKTLDEPAGEVITDPSTLNVGDIVAVRGHGRIRCAVITKVGSKNAQALFTTPGALRTAADIRLIVTDNYFNRSAVSEQAAEVAGRNYDFYAEEAGPGAQYGQQATYRAQVESLGTREECTERARQDELDRVDARYAEMKEQGHLFAVNFTNATVKPGQAKLLRGAPRPGHPNTERRRGR